MSARARRPPGAGARRVTEPQPYRVFVPGDGQDRFGLSSPFEPRGDQPQAIRGLVAGLQSGVSHQVLLGVTGSGKTFTMAQTIAAVNRPALVIAPNKTLAAQLYQEFRHFFPDNAVEYFVSYYDYYQPEAYIPTTDTYIEKEATINDEIDRMRHSATRALFERRDVIVVASVSCIYGLGSPEAYYGMLVMLDRGERVERDKLLRDLVRIQYERNDVAPERGQFRVRGDVIEIHPSYDEWAIRVELFGDEVERLAVVDALTGRALREVERIPVYPKSHYVTPREQLQRAIRGIQQELDERLAELEAGEHRLEAQRLRQRTLFDLEMLREVGYTHGIENYSRHLTGRAPGDPPPTLMDYLPADAVVVVDESHVTIPQLRGMYRGDRSRKQTLVEHGFRLPSAMDNRPLTFEEWQQRVGQLVYVSATPGPYELEQTSGEYVEQVIRPTGLVDPEVLVRPVGSQVDDLLGEIRQRVALGDRVFVTTLTKRMAEDLTEYLRDLDVRVRYLHSDIDTLERISILSELRRGGFDVLVGINLLREGLDVPEVSLVAILDADKEGFLRSARSLIQTIGRAARNVRGTVILYADSITGSMREALDETSRRRDKQLAYNLEHGITPETVVRELDSDLGQFYQRDFVAVPMVRETSEADAKLEAELDATRLEQRIAELTREMQEAAKRLEFERAAELRDRLKPLRERRLEIRL